MTAEDPPEYLDQFARQKGLIGVWLVALGSASAAFFWSARPSPPSLAYDIFVLGFYALWALVFFLQSLGGALAPVHARAAQALACSAGVLAGLVTLPWAFLTLVFLSAFNLQQCAPGEMDTGYFFDNSCVPNQLASRFMTGWMLLSCIAALVITILAFKVAALHARAARERSTDHFLATKDGGRV